MIKPMQTSATGTASRPRPDEDLLQLLLLEPDYMIRRTVSGTARFHGLANVREAADLESALKLLASSPFDGAIVAISEGDQELELVRRVRNGTTASATNAGVAVTVDNCDAARLDRLQRAGVSGVMIRPFKVKTLLKTIETLRGTPAKSGPAGSDPPSGD